MAGSLKSNLFDTYWPRIIGLTLFVLVGCRRSQPPPNAIIDYYKIAKEKAAADQLDSVIYYLDKYFVENDSINPMDIVLDSSFYALTDSAYIRADFRSLLLKHARSERAILNRISEKGGRITVSGKLVNNISGEAIPGAVIEFVHADAEGKYFNEDTKWNPRLFGYVKTNSKGEFTIKTIRPGQYIEEGSFAYSHIHYTIDIEGYIPLGGEFTFEDDEVYKQLSDKSGINAAKGQTGGYFVTLSLDPQN